MCGLDGRSLSGTGKFKALGFDGNTDGGIADHNFDCGKLSWVSPRSGWDGLNGPNDGAGAKVWSRGRIWGGGGSGYFGKRKAADLCRKKNH